MNIRKNKMKNQRLYPKTKRLAFRDGNESMGETNSLSSKKSVKGLLEKFSEFRIKLQERAKLSKFQINSRKRFFNGRCRHCPNATIRTLFPSLDTSKQKIWTFWWSNSVRGILYCIYWKEKKCVLSLWSEI